jgi:secondary thiamine-phosphate synthase enzyme
MRTHQEERPTSSRRVPDFIDITDEIQAALDASGIDAGQVTVFSPHASCAILVNERESGLLEDIKRTLERLSSNGATRRYGIIGSPSVVFPAMSGRLALGTWQRVLLVELEKAGPRSIVVQIVGE